MSDSLGVLELIEADLRRDDWGQDGLLHCSTDLIGSLRHTMLRMAGAPRKPEHIASLSRLATGTMWHSKLGNIFSDAHKPAMLEVSVNRGLPEGWGGVADVLFWDERRCGFVLLDLKTSKGSGLAYIERDGAKEDHIWQTSAYWNALVTMGYPMVEEIGVIYWPIDQDYKSENPVEPVMAWVTPLDELLVRSQMEERKAQVDAYLSSLDWGPNGEDPRYREFARSDPRFYLMPQLADSMPRTQKLFKQGDSYNVTLVPWWGSMFCPYDTALCDCGHELEGTKTTKIGTWQHNSWGWEYIPRTGYEDVQPDVKPQGRIAA